MRERLQGSVEAGLGTPLDYHKASVNAASLRWVPPHTLWGVNRLDLAVKVLYARRSPANCP